LGAHRRECEACGYQEYAYNSCRNRHCPKCQYRQKEEWMAARQAELLPVAYHHVVFTVPQEVRDLMLLNQTVMYDLLFQASAETLQTFGRDPKWLGAELGFLGVLHTWSQTLAYHPHLHYIVPAGGLAPDGKEWVRARSRGQFLFPVRALSQVMRGKFIGKLKQAYRQGRLRFKGKIADLAEAVTFHQFLNELARKRFYSYSKPPLAGPEQVIGYLGRYTHRVAISNQRLLEIEGGFIRFRYKDSQAGGKERVMRLQASEFMRRFLLHVLPKGFKKLRYYGYLSSGQRGRKLALARRLLAVAQAVVPKTSEVVEQVVAGLGACPVCRAGRLVFKGLAQAWEVALVGVGQLSGGRSDDTS